ncbi:MULTISPECIES: ParB N-terminal domain-containing protein [Leptospira]|uniref:ParB N-terminal domain-containing protein n=1 Tax=Leptospira TaxID=171 RepID=UPI0002928504|nr:MULTISPECIES: ParB N-terminal domain-containing protein [Leptospira]EKO87927.1 ParB-like protein [Leptospira interrogans serovar Grippotyphosa str. Andaman]EKP84876.1 ParB-like protein [Leptospira interrogans serovar Grippotyphosa str. 2006006986]EKR34866.1 ParB-like protein [Leptospira interrogans serovar Hebdomadis str. R499]EMJ52942.1 ParB-like protein [Leptospira interrogans str. UT126]EMN33813.1 ParB-like protein [Leptospira interrogans serovar Medanensis str. L0448]
MKKKETSTKVSLEEKAKEWMDAQESTPRPGSIFKKQYIPKGVTLSPIVKMVPPSSLKPNPRNDFDPLTEEEYESLKENIALNGILDALTARKDGTLVTGENRYRIALELQKHEDENVRRRVENIPVRHYMNELTAEEEYDILEGDNLFRRHLTAEQRKERLKRRILRKYKDELVQDNRGGDRKSESSKILIGEETKQERDLESEMLSEEKLGSLFKETESKVQDEFLISNSSKDLVKNESSLVGSGSEKSKIQGESLIFSKKEQSENLAVKISKNENIPRGTAQRYIAELRKELKTKNPKSIAKKEKDESKIKTLKSKDKVKEFQKKYSKMSSTAKKAEVNRLVSKLVILRKKRKRLDEEMMNLLKEDSEIVEKLVSVGEKKKVQGLSV